MMKIQHTAREEALRWRLSHADGIGDLGLA